MSKFKVTFVIALTIVIILFGFLTIKKEMFRKSSISPSESEKITSTVLDIQENEESKTSNDNIQENDAEVKDVVEDNKTIKDSVETKQESKPKEKKESSQQVIKSETTITTKDEKPKEKETKEFKNEQTPWEKLGLTEDQYKNQPMYSWEEVDFGTKDECMNYGNEHAAYGFECSEVTSWTRSLGWDYKSF